MSAQMSPLIKSRMRQVKTMHFIGIGGVGMGGIAEVVHKLGFKVTGSDLSQNPLTERLQSLGVTIFVGHTADNVSAADVVVVSTAVPADNPELSYARERQIPIVPRAVMLGELMRQCPH